MLLLLPETAPLCPRASTSATSVAALAPNPRAAEGASLLTDDPAAFRDDQGRRKLWAALGVLLLLQSAECCLMKLLATLLAAVLATRCATFCWRSFRNSRGSGCRQKRQQADVRFEQIAMSVLQACARLHACVQVFGACTAEIPEGSHAQTAVTPEAPAACLQCSSSMLCNQPSQLERQLELVITMHATHIRWWGQMLKKLQ